MSNSSPPTTDTFNAFFYYIEHSQQPKSFGRILDAGTGVDSIRWIAHLIKSKKASSYTAITADEQMRSLVLDEVQKLGIENDGEIVIGNWFQTGEEEKCTELCRGEVYDVILADYLIGAMDGFSPYFQDLIFSRLTPHLKPNGRLYIAGLQPTPNELPGGANAFCKAAKVRDACILLADQRCYREYPLDWVIRNVQRAEMGLRVLNVKKYPIIYDQSCTGPNTYDLIVAKSKLYLFKSKELAAQMEKLIEGLEKETREVVDKSSTGKVAVGFDYVVVAEKIGCNHVSRSAEEKKDSLFGCGTCSDD